MLSRESRCFGGIEGLVCLTGAIHHARAEVFLSRNKYLRTQKMRDECKRKKNQMNSIVCRTFLYYYEKNVYSRNLSASSDIKRTKPPPIFNCVARHTENRTATKITPAHAPLLRATLGNIPRGYDSRRGAPSCRPRAICPSSTRHWLIRRHLLPAVGRTY